MVQSFDKEKENEIKVDRITKIEVRDNQGNVIGVYEGDSLPMWVDSSNSRVYLQN